MWPPAPRVKSPPKIKKPRATPEDDLQSSVVAFLDLALPAGCGVFWSATLNGVRVQPKTRYKLKRLGLRSGVPDLVFVVLYGPRAGSTYWIELKAKGGSVHGGQKLVLPAMINAGTGAVCRDISQVVDALTGWGIALRASI